MRSREKKEQTKKISIILENSTVDKIEFVMSVFKIRSYNTFIRTALIQGYSIDQLYKYATLRDEVNELSKLDVNKDEVIIFK